MILKWLNNKQVVESTATKSSEGLYCLETSLRSRMPEETLNLMNPYMGEMNILDLVDHTINAIPSIPIYEAVRPSSPSGYFCLGKGFTKEASMASALMEATEMALVENPRTGKSVPLSDLPCESVISRPAWTESKLLRNWETSLPPETSMLPGIDLLSNRNLFVPEKDLTYRPGWTHSRHGPSTNGLSSGNTINEALIHGLSELFERDAMHRWILRSVFFPPEIIPVSNCLIGDKSVVERLEQIFAYGYHVSITRLPCDHPVNVIEAQLIQPVAEGRVLAFSGWGCHIDELIAVKRAVAESVQILATHLAVGSGAIPYERLPGKSRGQKLKALSLGDKCTFERNFDTRLTGEPPRLWTQNSGLDNSLKETVHFKSEKSYMDEYIKHLKGNCFYVELSPSDLPVVAVRSVASALKTPAGL